MIFVLSATLIVFLVRKMDLGKCMRETDGTNE
jgi:hypothetical protein